MLLFHLCTGFQNAPNTNTLAATGPSPYSKILYCCAFKCLFQQNSTFDLLLSCGFTPTVYTNLVCLKCLFLQNRFLHGMAWHANANATVPPSSSASKADPVPVWTQPNLSSLIIHILVKRLTWLLKTFYHVEDQTRYQIQIQIQIQLLIPIWVKRLTCVLTTFDYGEDQTHWQSL